MTADGRTHVRLGDVAHQVSKHEHDPASAGLDRYVGLEHLDPQHVTVERWGSIADGTTFTKRFRAGQLLFAKRRAYQRKAAVAAFDGLCSGDLIVIEAKPEALLPELLSYIVHTDRFLDHALRTSSGSLSPRTKWKDLAEYEFDLPLLDRQQDIVEILNTSVEAGKAEARVAAHVQTLRRAYVRSILNQLIPGRGPIRMRRGIDADLLTLGDVAESGEITLGRGKVISKTDLAQTPGTYPVYSSSATENGVFGRYGRFMFDEEMLTWSIDGGGRPFYRSKHKFSVTNVGGYLRINDPSLWDYPFVHAMLEAQHEEMAFDWQNKAHPSVIKRLYVLPGPPIEDQRRIGRVLDELTKVRESTTTSVLLTLVSQLTATLLNVAVTEEEPLG